MKKKKFLFGIAVVFATTCFTLPMLSFTNNKTVPNSLEGGCDEFKAKAILWVDYKKGKRPGNGDIAKCVKVYADVSPFGKVKILSYCKKQPMKVEDYLQKHLEQYTIRKEILDQHYIEPGEQYLQLRYIANWMNK